MVEKKLPKIVKSSLESSYCEYCKEAVCQSNCEQEIKGFNDQLPSIKSIAELTGIPHERFLGVGRGADAEAYLDEFNRVHVTTRGRDNTLTVRVAEGQNIQPGHMINHLGELAQLGGEAPVGVVISEPDENNEVRIVRPRTGTIVWTHDGVRWIARED